ncbi:nSTAND1 domain-containing NTPase [Tardiphaga sp. 20_F10_N6_6]|uniref:nSTAND1 domain-containing NTPase n=1 Tax=Tardiphaga sp. 20_F10_N6_6 TaxID=3240788 RepID=UPI003F8B474D
MHLPIFGCMTKRGFDVLVPPSELHRLSDQPKSRDWPAEPYKGLNYFQYSDAPLFGERDADIQNCCALIGLATNKVLLLHGRSGTGKSSFLRAGLLPTLELARFSSFRGNVHKGPLLIRCTADPVGQIHTWLLERLQENTYEFIDKEKQVAAVEALQRGDYLQKRELVSSILEACSLLSRASMRPLVIALDQAEEIFTLGVVPDALAALFNLIEELCIRSIDIKLIVAIRTEYYGQFCDQLRIDPNLSVSARRTSLDQYMLHGLKDKEQLVSTIVRPTIDVQIGAMIAPREVYRFFYSKRLPEIIADDLLAHCGTEASVLPVLQIVCRDLYRSKTEDQVTHLSEITHEQYAALGKVNGRVNAFVEKSIADAIVQVEGSPPSRQEVERWQELLSDLVGRQEGGVVTTLLIDEESFILDAEAKGIKGSIRLVLEQMADQSNGLLRISRHLDVEGTPSRQFSLGHDSLAPSLFAWGENRYDVLQVRKASRRLKVWLVLSLAVIVAAVAALSYQTYAIRLRNVRLLEVRAEADTSVGYRSRILLTLAAIDAGQGVFSRYLSAEANLVRLKSLIERIPAYVSEPNLALAESRLHNSFVGLNTRGQIQLIDRASYVSTAVGTITVRSTSEVTSPQAAIGYVDGLNAPVVYQGGVLSWWPNERLPLQSPPDEINIAKIFPSAFGDQGFTWVEVAKGHLRLTQVTFAPRTYKFVELKFDGANFRAGDVIPMAWPGAIWPTFSNSSDRFAYFNANLELFHSSRLRPGTTTKVGAPPENSLKGGAQSAEQFFQSLGFSSLEEAIVSRRSRAEIFIYPFASPDAPIKLELYEAKQDRPVRPRFGSSRPLIAAVRLGNVWRVAWMSEEGINVVEGAGGRIAKLVKPQELLPAVPADSIVRLEFAADGNRLVAVSQSSFQDPLIFKIWDLSDAWRAKVDGMNKSEAQTYACNRLGKRDANLTALEINSWFEGRRVRPPCEGD